MGIEEIKSLCAKYGIRPSKKLGQNFLIDARIARMMVDAANLQSEDCVVEVGPGFGALTKELAGRVGKVVAVEKDARLAQALKDSPLGGQRTVLQIAHGDILKISNQRLAEIVHNSPQPSLNLREGDRSFPPLKLRGGEGGVMSRSYKVVASLPYSITSAVLRKFTEEEPRPEVCVFLVQKEVAERVCASPGKMSVLSVAVQYYGRPEIMAQVPASAFWPVPEVESAILKITPSVSPPYFKGEKKGVGPYLKGEKIEVDEKRLFQIVRIGFSSRRKQLQNNLTAGLRLPREQVVAALAKVGLLPTVRAQELAVQDWIALTREI